MKQRWLFFLSQEAPKFVCLDSWLTLQPQLCFMNVISAKQNVGTSSRNVFTTRIFCCKSNFFCWIFS